MAISIDQERGEAISVDVIESGLNQALVAIGATAFLDPRCAPCPAEPSEKFWIDLDPDEGTEKKFRDAMAEIGPGRSEDIGPDELGLEDGEYTAVVHGGSSLSLLAQLAVLNVVGGLSDIPRPKEIIYVAPEYSGLSGVERNDIASFFNTSPKKLNGAHTQAGRFIAERLVITNHDIDDFAVTVVPVATYPRSHGSFLQPYAGEVVEIFQKRDPVTNIQREPVTKLLPENRLMTTLKGNVARNPVAPLVLVSNGSDYTSNVYLGKKLGHDGIASDVRVVSYGQNALARVVSDSMPESEVLRRFPNGVVPTVGGLAAAGWDLQELVKLAKKEAIAQA